MSPCFPSFFVWFCPLYFLVGLYHIIVAEIIAKKKAVYFLWHETAACCSQLDQRDRSGSWRWRELFKTNRRNVQKNPSTLIHRRRMSSKRTTLRLIVSGTGARGRIDQGRGNKQIYVEVGNLEGCARGSRIVNCICWLSLRITLRSKVDKKKAFRSLRPNAFYSSLPFVLPGCCCSVWVFGSRMKCSLLNDINV